MEEPVDLGLREAIDWLRADAARAGGARLTWAATREFQSDGAGFPGAAIDPEDGLDCALTVGTLEIAPRGGGPRWTLRLRIEDAIGSHLPEDGSVPDEPEALDLDAFEAAFLPGDGDAGAEALLEAESAEARRAFETLRRPG